MNKPSIVLITGLLVLTCCTQYKKGDGELLYKIHEDKSGASIKAGDFIGLTAVEKTVEGEVTYNSHDYDRPSYMYCGNKMFDGDLYSGLYLLSEGDSATLKVSIDSMVKIGRVRPANTKGKYFVYDIRVTDIISKGTLSDSVFRANVNSFMKARAEGWKKEESLKISRFISSNNLNPIITPSGLHYQVLKKGKGLKPASGDTVDVHYTIKLLSGKVIASTLLGTASSAESSLQKLQKPVRWFMGAEREFFTPGFSEAVSMFASGTQVKLILPSHLAYGPEGKQGIPPYMPLVIDIKIEKITHKKAES